MLQEVLSQVSIEVTGFKSANETNTHLALQNPDFGGATKLYDAILGGSLKIVKTLDILKNLDALDKYKFVHIVLTDGDDNSSQSTYSDVEQIFQHLQKVSILQTHLIDVENNSQKLKQLAEKGGDNCHYHFGKSSQIQEIFQKITMGIQLERKTTALNIQSEEANLVLLRQQVNPQLYIKVNRFCVVLTVDTSYSMKGNRYNQLLLAVKQLQDQLGKDDFIQCIRFDKKLQEVDITNEGIKKKYQERQQQKNNSVCEYQQKKQNSKNGCCNIF